MKSRSLKKIMHSVSDPSNNIWSLTFVFPNNGSDVKSPPFNTYVSGDGVISNPTKEWSFSSDTHISSLELGLAAF
jgi:hypothetical protein